MEQQADFQQNSGVLTKIFSTATAPKILDFFLDHKELDYSTREIAENCDVSIKTIMRELPKLELLGLISSNRKIGKTPLYQLNQQLTAIELLSEFTLAVSQTEPFLEPHRKKPLQDVIEVSTDSISNVKAL